MQVLRSAAQIPSPRHNCVALIINMHRWSVIKAIGVPACKQADHTSQQLQQVTAAP